MRPSEFENRAGVILRAGDRVIDPMDNSIRTIGTIDADEGSATLNMADGGCIGADELGFDCFVE